MRENEERGNIEYEARMQEASSTNIKMQKKKFFKAKKYFYFNSKFRARIILFVDNALTKMNFSRKAFEMPKTTNESKEKKIRDQISIFRTRRRRQRSFRLMKA